MRRATALLLTLALLIPLAGCMRTVRARSIQFSDFLDDYHRLSRGDRHDPLYTWRNPTTDWTRYDSLILDPVLLWGDAKIDRRIRPDEKRNLTAYFYNRLYIALAPDYLMLDAPQPNTLRLQVAVTRIEPRRPLLDTASNLSTLSLVTTSVAGAVTGKTPFCGELSLELRITDAATGRTLAEGADRRIGGKWLPKGLDPWADAYAAIDAFTHNLAYRLCTLRNDPDCDPPLQP